jgi:radical SAM superfamily enzyme YgiQ (UPF0313 family)
MHVTLVKPMLGPMADGSRFVDEARMEPLTLGVLAGLTPAGVDITLFDDRIDPFDPDTPTDLVAITVETFTARRAYEIADAYRARRVPVVLGGVHATLLPEEAAAHADALVLGDAEGVWGSVVADAHAGALAARYRGAPGVPQAGTLPRRDLYADNAYLPLALVQFGRGCPYRCDFCAVGAVASGRHCSRPLAEVLAEVHEILAAGRRDLFFVDDNLIADREGLKDLLRALIPLRVRWVSQVSVEHCHDPELLELFAASGCLGNVIGFESLTPASLREAQKAPNLRASPRYADEIAALRAHHLQTWAALVLGFDADTVESLAETCEWAIAQRFAFAAFNLLTPYPGTPLYQRLAEEGRLLYDGAWWRHPDYRFNHAPFKPAQMTADELTDVAWRCRQRWSSPGSILRRVLDPATHLHSLERVAVYALYNPLFRREAFKKQGMRLGGGGA